MQTYQTKICSRCQSAVNEEALECRHCGYAFRVKFTPPGTENKTPQNQPFTATEPQPVQVNIINVFLQMSPKEKTNVLVQIIKMPTQSAKRIGITMIAILSLMLAALLGMSFLLWMINN